MILTDGGINAVEDNLPGETRRGPVVYPIDTSKVSFLKQAILAPHECRGSQEHPDYYYTVDHWPANYVKVVHSDISEKPREQTPYNTTRILNDKLSSYFYLDAACLTLHDRTFYNTLLSRIPGYGEDPFISIHLPPPKAV